MSYFPMFVEMKNCKCLIVGGGKIALRKIEVLMDFGAKVDVIAPEIIPAIKQMKEIAYQEREFELTDLETIELVVAATDHQEVNHWISSECKKRKIPVNAADQIEDCTFIFSSYVKSGEVVAAFSSGGKSPVVTQYLKEQVKPLVNEQLGELAACLGSMRECVKGCVATEEERKQVYQRILRIGLEQDQVPNQMEINQIIMNCNSDCEMIKENKNI